MRHGSKGSIALMASLLLSASAASGQPWISKIQQNEIARSGRIAITGSGFGIDEGEVLVGGQAAWTATWTDARIVAYVPESSPLGETTLSVVAAGAPSNEILFDVVERVANGRIRWTFETDGINQWWSPALAPDGTVYLHTNNDYDGLVYAIAPDGALRWLRKVNWYPYVPPTAGPDGAVYVGSIGSLYRISPQGDIDWIYQPDGINIEVAPNVGPNGLLYGAFEISGAFALEPLTGDVVWENPGVPMMTSKSGDGVEARFGPSGPGQPVDQFYLSMDGGAGFYAFSLDGEQLFTASFGNISGTAEVAVGSDGTIYGPRAIGLLVAAAEPSAGGTLWEYFPHWAVGTDNVEIGPDDTLYFKSNGCSQLEAFNPDTVEQKWITPMTYCYRRPAVSADGSLLVAHGTDGADEPDFLRAFDPETGDRLWTTKLQSEDEYVPQFRVMGVDHPRITPDRATAYVSTLSLIWNDPENDERAVLYAIDLAPEIPCASVTRFAARCTADGRLQFGAMFETGYDDQTVTFGIDDQMREVTVADGRAVGTWPGQGGTGERTVSLTDPAGCFAPQVVSCR